MTRSTASFLMPVIAAALLAGCAPGEGAKAGAQPKLKELVIKDVEEGEGDPLAAGKVAIVEYEGSLLSDGTVFDGNLGGTKAPFKFVVGQKQVIPGWDEGVIGMKPGGTRELQIPAAKGYGAEGGGDKIPPNADLKFTVKLLGAFDPADSNFFSRKDTAEGAGPAAKKGDTVSIRYEGKYLNGFVFDNNHKENPVTVELGKFQVNGLNHGLVGMKKGGKRTLTLGPGAAFGPYGMGAVEGNQIVIFDVELVDLKPKG